MATLNPPLHATPIVGGIDTPDTPPPPATLADTGLAEGFVQELLLKTLYVHGARLGQQLADTVCLPLTLVDEQLLTLQQRRLVEVRGTAGTGRGAYLFEIAGEGRQRAQDALESSHYVGPAPVPLEQYSHWLNMHTIRDVHVTRERIVDGFRELVVDRPTLDLLGPAINSAKSLFLYGESGNGKTLMADTIAGMLGGSMYVPYSVLVDGQIMLVFDPVYHRPVARPRPGSEAEGASIWRDLGAEHDRRFARVRRPVVVTGGELTLHELDLQYDGHTKLYQAPFQMKANGGVLIIDDFGRQRVPPRDLLNRWIVPLEKRIDYLTLHTGTKFPVPFDCLLIFATNLDPKSLVEEAFLRRIHYKIHVKDPTREQYEEIFRRCCEARGIPYSDDGVAHVYGEYYGRRGIAARSCHPRDITDHVLDVARFLEIPPSLDADLLDRACESYFLDVTELAHEAVWKTIGTGD
jgi:predicted ATPase with chaperone activity